MLNVEEKTLIEEGKPLEALRKALGRRPHHSAQSIMDEITLYRQSLPKQLFLLESDSGTFLVLEHNEAAAVGRFLQLIGTEGVTVKQVCGKIADDIFTLHPHVGLGYKT